MAKKKSTICKPPKKDNRPPGVMKLADGTVVEERYRNDYGSRSVFQKDKEDEEAKAPPPKDEFSKMKYPPPKKNPAFRQAWGKFIKSVTSRESFKEAHLSALEVLCDLYVEYEDLERTIRVEGRTYKRVSRFGETRAMHPAVGQMDKVRANIRQYTKMLDLFPKRDHGGDSEGEEEQWE